MSGCRLLTVAILLAVISPAGAAPSFDRAKVTHPDELAIFFNPELSRPGVIATGGYKYVRPRYGHRYATQVDLSLIKGQQACAPDVACIKQCQFLATRTSHGLGAPIGNFQIDQAPQFLWDYHGTIAGYSR